MIKRMVINLAIISLVAISVLLWTTFFKEYSNLNKTEKTAPKEEQTNEQVEEEAVPVQKTEQKAKEIWVKEEHGIFLVYTYNSNGEEAKIAYNEELETILEQLGEPDQKEQDLDTINYLYGDLSIGVDSTTNLVTFIHFANDGSIFETEWYKKLGEPHFAEDEGTYFYNKERDLILKFDEYQDIVNVNLFKNYPETLDDEMTTEQPNLESPQQEFKTLKDPIYGGDIIKIGPFGPVGTPGETSWVAAEIKPLLGGGGFAPYEENGQLPQQVFKPLDKVVHTADLSFWLEPVDDSSLMIMSGEYVQFYLCVRLAPKPRYDSYYFSANLMFLTQGSRQKLPINKMDNIEIKIAN